MATRADEFEPERPSLNAVIDRAVRPILLACEEAVGGSFFVTITVWVQDSVGTSVQVMSSGVEVASSPVSAEVRLRFRKTINPHRILFRAEAIFQGVPPKSGFSGFNLRGDVVLDSTEIRVKDGGGAYRYNVREWQGWV